ncbi:MAG: GAF domain-containing protein [Ferruginibacter sp.]|nr:GAF domain-containing protein [Cytophagales bacterium]
MKKFEFNLQNQLRLAFLALTLFLIGVLSVYSGFNLIGNKNQLKASAAQQVSKSITEKIDRNFYERFGDVQAFAANVLAVETARHRDSLAQPTQKFINTMVSYYVLYDLMMIADAEGNVLACNTVDKSGNPLTTGSLLGTNVSGTDWFRACTAVAGPEGGAWYSDFGANPAVAQLYRSNGWGMGFAAPIRNEEGKVVGVWYNFASWKEVTQGIRQEALTALRESDPLADIFLTNQAGNVIDASDESLVLNTRITPQLLQKQSLRFTTQSQTIRSEDCVYGLAVASGAYTYQGKHWHCFTFIPKAPVTLAAFFTGEILLISLVILGVSFVISNGLSRRIVGKIHRLHESVHRLSGGDLSQTQPQLSGRDELNEMEVAVCRLTEGIRQTSSFAEAVGRGNFEASFTPMSENDTLGNALLKMHENLRLVAEEDYKRNWTAEGLAQFAGILRANHDRMQLANAILSQLVKYLGAHQGALFVVEGSESGGIWLALVASYAFDRKKYLEKKVLAGEGLLGQAYLERDTIYLTRIPADHVRITSGLGDSQPSCLLIVPLKVNNSVEGVIELASFRALEPHEIAFVEKLSENIASTLASAKINERTRHLLEESQQQAEALRAQEEEVRQNLEELEATQEEMQRKEKQYLAVIAGLQPPVDSPPAIGH